MEKGLQNILGRIAMEPQNKVLQSRFLSLASELAEPAKLDAILALAKIFVTSEPGEAIRLARMVRETHPAEYRGEAASIIRQSLAAQAKSDGRKTVFTQSEVSVGHGEVQKTQIVHKVKQGNRAKKVKKAVAKKNKSSPRVVFEEDQTQIDLLIKEPRAQKQSMVFENTEIKRSQKEVYTFSDGENYEKEAVVLETDGRTPELNENDTFVDLVLDQIPSSSRKSIEIARKQKAHLSVPSQKTAFFTVDVEPTVSKIRQVSMTLEESKNEQEASAIAVAVDLPEVLSQNVSRSSFLAKSNALPDTVEDKEILNLMQFLYGDYPDVSCVELLEGRVGFESTFSLKAFYCMALVRNGRSRNALYFLQCAFEGVSTEQKEHLDTIYQEIARDLGLPDQANYLERRVLPAFLRQVL